MKKILKPSLYFALLFSLGVNAEPCWQSHSTASTDGRLCIVIDDEAEPGKATWYFGRVALDLDENQEAGQEKHFCAYEALINNAHVVKQSRDYFWLNATKEDVAFALQKQPKHENNPGSPDQSDKWVLDSGTLVKSFKFCSAEEAPNADVSGIKFCARSLPGNAIGFGKFSWQEKCKLFDAGMGEGQVQMPMSELQARRKELPDVSWIGVGWAVRDGQPFATHTVFDVKYSTEYCLLQAMIRGHKYCSVDKTGHYQTGNKIDFDDKDAGINDVYQLHYSDQLPKKSEL